MAGKKGLFINGSASRIKAGCGGIDIFSAVYPYDFNYLVQKLEHILQGAPAVAFDLALNVLCEPCSKAIKSMESIADQLNHMSSTSVRHPKQSRHTPLIKRASRIYSVTPMNMNPAGTVGLVLGLRNYRGLSDSYQSIKQSIIASSGTSVDMHQPMIW